MKIVKSVAEMQSLALRAQMKGTSIGFVPTMGALHAGHQSLVQRARAENDLVIVSIFVNPLQFGPNEDFKRYPRTLSADLALLKKEEVDYVFTPAASDMYSEGFGTVIDVPALTQTLCGPLRPGHFQGVATVVAKLFQITQPTRAYFGEKDYQQIRMIERLALDLRMPVRIIACPTVRERDGLALSSRNRALTRAQRDEAVKLYQALYLGRELVEGGFMKDAARLVRRLSLVLKHIRGVRVEYISVVDPSTLQPMTKIRRPALLAVAARIGNIRLIDNVIIP